MVGFVGRFRKPKLPVALGSPHEDNIALSQRPTTPRHFSPPVLRNFSYPFNVGNPEPPPFPSGPKAGQTSWDQLGEICSFSPDGTSRIGQARLLGLDNPFLFKSESERYTRLDDSESETLDKSPRQERGNVEKSAEKNVLKGKARKLSKSQSLGDRIFTPNSTITSRLKRTSLGQHKSAASFDTSHILLLPSTDPDRPASSSGVTIVDTKFKSPSRTAGSGPSPLLLPQGSIDDILANTNEERLVSEATTAIKSLEMGSSHHRKTSYGQPGLSTNAVQDNGSRKRNDSVTESAKHKGKEGKQGWLSQLKDWVSVSEPSTQALKQYKKDTYSKAQIALDDPEANAKLHSPIGTLPPDVIKPAGRGPDPEEIAMKQMEQKRKIRLSGSRTGGTSQGSRSSSSRYSSSSSIAFGATTGEISP
ncbi:hypothetical protein F5Y06DRAFT_292887 [Hypoxylon sp. FL0890]|nr:hypothetical protein F5Y06DRAFT_292887 [Hypoxylon sp. FL0890]